MKDYFETHYRDYLGELSLRYAKDASRYRDNYGKLLSSYSRQAQCLDLACGVGNFVAYLNKEKFTNITGIDSSEQSIEICKAKFPKTTFYQDSLENYLSGNIEKYEIISMFSILEHLDRESVVEVLSLVKKRLSDEKGIFIFSTPNMEALFGNTGGRYNDFTHKIGYTESSLRQVLKLAGFTQIEIFGERSVGEGIIKKVIRKVYQPVIFKLLKAFILSLDLHYPSVRGLVLYGIAR